MNRLLSWKMLAGIVLIYSSGLLTGVLGTRLQLQQQIDSLSRKPQALVKNFALRRLATDVSLSPDQEEKIGIILASATSDWFSLRQKHRPELDELFQKTLAALKECLSQEQTARLDALLQGRKKD